ncbi:MAG TPA: phosphatase PAP2 family protein, partial [Blastocatellia bacterium]|nr:phosphatase PAP2 family protein [Blastocatellia bacterium]
RQKALFRLTLLAYVISCCLNLLIWTLWPTAYPRLSLPEGESLTLSAFHWLHAIDTPANCFPSGHITSPAVGCWALARENQAYRKWIWIGFALLSVTILTTKQHYAVDLIGGLMSAGIGIALASTVMSLGREEKLTQIPL